MNTVNYLIILRKYLHLLQECVKGKPGILDFTIVVFGQILNLLNKIQNFVG